MLSTEALQTHPTLAEFIIPNLIFILVYIFIIYEKFPKVVVVLLGASLLILLGILNQTEALSYVDFNVISLLVGMMIIVSILDETGAFNWLAYYSAKLSKGNGLKLLLLFSLITAITSAFLDNVTTVLFMASITCSLARRLQINPIPYLIAEVLSSNIGGTATLIGDPPNILIGSAAGLTFNEFLIHVAPAILLILPVTLATICWFYRNQLAIPEAAQKELANLSLDGLIVNPKLLRKALAVLSLVILGFVLHHTIHKDVGTIAIFGASILMLFERFDDVWNDVEWTTIFFFIGLFIIVGAVEKVGTLDILSERFWELTHGDFQIITLSLLWISGIFSAVIDNIPYTATMIPMVERFSTHYTDITPFWWALALGACLGGNGTIIGATANVIVIDIARRNGFHISFIDFFKIGFLVMIESLLIASVYLWLRYLI